jgi:hypothetical protein
VKSKGLDAGFREQSKGLCHVTRGPQTRVGNQQRAGESQLSRQCSEFLKARLAEQDSGANVEGESYLFSDSAQS